MNDRQLAIDINLTDLTPTIGWVEIDDFCEDHGFFEQLGREHCAGFLEAGNKLLVTFENAQFVRENNLMPNPAALPTPVTKAGRFFHCFRFRKAGFAITTFMIFLTGW